MSTTPTNVLVQLLAALNDGSLKIVDLTTPLEPATAVIDLPEIFAPSPGLTLTEISRYDNRGPAWYWNILNLGEHTGTHFDAPIHWITGKDLPNNATDTIAPRKFIGPASVIDITAEVEKNPDYLFTIEELEQWEAQHGRIPEGAWVFLRTGWSKRTEAKDFLNAQEDGAHSPGFHPTCSQLLATQRNILGVGVETVGTDAGQAGTFDPPFPNHTFMHGAGKFGLTSLINLDQLPPTGAIIIAAPLKIVDGSGSPVRVLAITA